MRDAGSQLGRLDLRRDDRSERVHPRRRDRPLRSLRVHGARRSRPRRRTGVARGALRHALRQPGAPRDDGSRRAQGLAAGQDDGIRAADRRRQLRAILRTRAPVTRLPLFPVTTVGSWPRPARVVQAQRDWRRQRIDTQEFTRVADEAIVAFLGLQHDLGVDIVTDGELRRDNFYSFVAQKLEGVRLMTLAEMLDVVEDKAGFEQLLQTLDVPAYSISSPICVGPVARREPLTVDDLRFARRHTDRPIKVTLPGPYLLTRAMFVPEVSRPHYRDKEALAEDVVALLREEIEELASEGADFVQLDEPVLTEVAFAPGRTRTFMCAALAARNDPAENVPFATTLISRVVDGFDGMRMGLHVSRGNWSRDEATLLSGGYHALKAHLDSLAVTQLVL